MSDIEKKAKEYLKRTGAAQVSATSDGFLFHEETMAKRHGRTLKDKEVTTYIVKAEEPESTTVADVIKLNLEQLADTVKEIDDLEEVKLLKEVELDQEKPRKGALAIYDARIKDLEADQKDATDADAGDEKEADQDDPAAQETAAAVDKTDKAALQDKAEE